MTPMIDVVFLLIIFFLVSSHLARREVRLELDLPKAVSAARDASVSPRLTINVRATGETLLGARNVSHTELLARLQSASDEHGAGLRVRVRGDEQATYETIEPVLAACSEAGIVDIGFGVYERRAER